VTRWLNRALAQGWTSWYGAWAEARAERDRFRGIVTRWLNRALAQGWSSWYGAWTERQEALRKLRHGAMKLLQRRLALGFAGWQAAHWAERGTDAMEKAVRRMMFQGLSRGWQAWHTAWVQSSSAASSMRAALHRWLHQRLVRGWCAWRLYARDMHALMSHKQQSALAKAQRHISELREAAEVADAQISELQAEIARLKSERTRERQERADEQLQSSTEKQEAKARADALLREVDDERRAKARLAAELMAARQVSATVTSLQRALVEADTSQKQAEARVARAKKEAAEEVERMRQELARAKKNAPRLRPEDLKAINPNPLRKEPSGMPPTSPRLSPR